MGRATAKGVGVRLGTRGSARTRWLVDLTGALRLRAGAGFGAWAALAGVVSLLAAAPAAGQSTHVLVVTGLGGSPQYTEQFADWGGGMVDAAVDAGVPRDNVVWLAERESVDTRVAGAARKEAVVAQLAGLAERSAPGDLVMLVLFGHGSARGDEVRLNLPGPDLSAGELAAGLEPLSSRRVVVVNAASASGGFVEPLSASGRVVITATRSTRENEATRFGGYFVRALAGGEADTDKDGRVSMLEAFEFARLEVARAYSTAGHLPTEHALLDDNGDGRGTLEPAAEIDGAAGDGALAARVALAPSASAAGPGAGDDAALRDLREEEARLQAELTELRARQGSMDPDAYQAALEELLVEIARTGRAIRAAQGGAAPDSGRSDPDGGADRRDGGRP